MGYKTGTVGVTNGSATVTGTGTLWLANLTANDLFTITGDFANAGINYRILSIATNTSLKLTTNYAGATIASGATYYTSSDFTSRGYPLANKGDLEPSYILRELAEMIDEDISTITTGTFAVPKEIFYLGQMTNGLEVRRNYIAKYAGTVNEVRILCEDAPVTSSAVIRVQV